MGIISGVSYAYHHRFEGEQVLVLLQKNLSKEQVKQTHSQLITKGHLLPNPNNLNWLNTLLYNALIRAHVKLCDPPKAFILFTRMLSHQAPPNNHTFPCLIKASTSFNSPFHAGTPLHSQVIKRGCCLDPFILTSFVALYGHFGYQLDAHKVFEQIPQPCIVSTNSMLHAFVNNGDVTSALSLFHTMPVKDVISWTSIISGLANNRCFQGALAHFKQMLIPQSLINLKPNEATLVTVLSACANSHAPGALYQGKQIHAYIIKHNLDITVFLGTALISMYGKTGSLQTAATIFNAMKTKQVCTWNAIISSLSSNGKHKEALTFFLKMKPTHGIQPNEVTLVALLASCARTQQVEFGFNLFQSMFRDFGVAPRMEHYGCVVDLLGRAGLFDEAVDVVRKMPFQPDATVLGALLGACKVHGAVKLAGAVGRKLLELQPQHCGRYVLLSNIYADAGKWNDAANLRKAMVQTGIRKIPAYSSLDF